jgi:hypothetical protein
MVKISPFTQYIVRKLLKQYCSQGQWPWGMIPVADPGQADLQRILQEVYPQPGQLASQINQLELLTGLYAQLKATHSTHRDEFNQLEQQILQVLGLRLGRLLPQQVPRWVPADATCPLRFRLEQHLYRGIRYEQQLYGLVKYWKRTYPLQAYRLAWVLVNRDIPCIMTRSRSYWAVWVSLRSPSARIVLKQGELLVRQLMRLYPPCPEQPFTLTMRSPGRRAFGFLSGAYLPIKGSYTM